MNPIILSLLLAGVLLNALGQLFLKAGTNAVGVFALSPGDIFIALLKLSVQPPIIAGVLCYLSSLIVWVVALSRTPVSIAYPILSIGYIVNAVAAWVLFGERLSFTKLAGMLIIIGGVTLVARD